MIIVLTDDAGRERLCEVEETPPLVFTLTVDAVDYIYARRPDRADGTPMYYLVDAAQEDS